MFPGNIWLWRSGNAGEVSDSDWCIRFFMVWRNQEVVIKMIQLNFHANFSSEIHSWVLHEDHNREFNTCWAGFISRNGFSKWLKKPIVQNPEKIFIRFISNLKLRYRSHYRQNSSLKVWFKIPTLQEKLRLEDKSFGCSSEVLIVPFSKPGHRWWIFTTFRLMFLRNYLFDNLYHVCLKNFRIVVSGFKKKTVSLLHFEPQ